jgi:hypothetical protein
MPDRRASANQASRGGVHLLWWVAAVAPCGSKYMYVCVIGSYLAMIYLTIKILMGVCTAACDWPRGFNAVIKPCIEIRNFKNHKHRTSPVHSVPLQLMNTILVCSPPLRCPESHGAIHFVMAPLVVGLQLET